MAYKTKNLAFARPLYSPPKGGFSHVTYLYHMAKDCQDKNDLILEFLYKWLI